MAEVKIEIVGEIVIDAIDAYSALIRIRCSSTTEK